MTTEPPHSSQRDEIIPGLTREQCHAARLARDARFDGRFFTGVLSTGIYCRPVCPARAPHEHNVRYFRFAAAAEQHGLRPCLRCRPELAPAQSGDLPPLVAQVLARIERGELAEHSLGSLATQAGITERTLRRQFEQHLGASPKQVEQTRRLLLAKRLLTETRLPITDVAFAAGFASIRRFNDAWLQAYGMTPGALRKQEGGLARRRRNRACNCTCCIARRSTSRPCSRSTGCAPFRGWSGWMSTVTSAVTGSASRRGSSASSPSRERLRLTVRDLPPSALPDILYRVRRMWDLDADMSRIGEHLGQDPLLAGIQGRWPGVRLPGVG